MLGYAPEIKDFSATPPNTYELFSQINDLVISPGVLSILEVGVSYLPVYVPKEAPPAIDPVTGYMVGRLFEKHDLHAPYKALDISEGCYKPHMYPARQTVSILLAAILQKYPSLWNPDPAKRGLVGPYPVGDTDQFEFADNGIAVWVPRSQPLIPDKFGNLPQSTIGIPPANNEDPAKKSSGYTLPAIKIETYAKRQERVTHMLDNYKHIGFSPEVTRVLEGHANNDDKAPVALSKRQHHSIINAFKEAGLAEYVGYAGFGGEREATVREIAYEIIKGVPQTKASSLEESGIFGPNSTNTSSSASVWMPRTDQAGEL